VFPSVFVYVSYLIVYLYSIFVSKNIFFWVTFSYEYLCEWDSCGWRNESCISVLIGSEVCIKNFSKMFVL
jgi:hypothetical protein